jgi:hypothetical protein
MGKASQAATKEFQAKFNRAKRKQRVITDSIVTKIVRGQNARITFPAKRILKALVISKGVQYFAQGDVARLHQNMSTIMPQHLDVNKNMQKVPDVHFNVLKKKSTQIKSLI